MIPGRVPDRVIRRVENLRAEFQIFRFGQVEFFIGRGVEADDARAYDRITSGITETEVSCSGNSVHVRVGIEKSRTGLIPSRQIRTAPRGIRVTDAAAILDVAGAA